MKFNIQKLQQGGGLLPLTTYSYSDYNPNQQPTDSPAPAAQAAGSKSTELLSKGTIEDLIKRGMPNEVETFMKQLKKVETSSPFTSSFDTNQLYDLASKASQIISNGDTMREATTQAAQNGGLGEYAVTTTGSLYVRDAEGSLANISLSDFAKNRDKYQALTVNDLTQARRYDPKLSFDKTVISTIQNATGIDKISDHIVKVLKDLGTEEGTTNIYKSKTSLYNDIKGDVGTLNGKTPTDMQKAGLKQLNDVYNRMGTNGMYDLTTTDSTQRNHINEASAFILSTLPKSSQDLLKARAVINGTGLDAKNLISIAFGAFSSESHKSDVHFDEGMTKIDVGPSGTGKDDFHMNALEELMTGDINKQKYSITNPEDGSVEMTLPASIIGSVMTLKNDPVPATTLKNVLDNSKDTGIRSLVDTNNMWFGGKQINNSSLDAIVYNGGEMAKVWVPVDNDGHPDLKMASRYSDAEKKIAYNNITDPTMKNAVYKEFNLNMQLDPKTGKPTTNSQVKEFLTFTGSTSDKNGGVGDNNIYTYHPTGAMQNSEKDRLSTIFKQTSTKTNTVSYPDGWWGPGMSDVVTAPIFLALNSSAKNTLGALSGHGVMAPSQSIQTNIINTPNQHPLNASLGLLNTK